MPDLSTWALLALVTVATSTVSGVIGLAGGMLLLSALLLVFDPVVAIPLHGAVQLVSNGSRAWFQRPHVRWDAVVRFVWPLLPAGALGLSLLRSIPADAGASRSAASCPRPARRAIGRTRRRRLAIRAGRCRGAARWLDSSAPPLADRFRTGVRWVLTAVALGVAWEGARRIAAG